MCGITGFIDSTGGTSKEVLEKMVASLKHRGPDDSGAEVFNFNNATIGFGQSRLSIIDLSHGGHQPMHYKNVSCVFNGEIYNYTEVREELIKLNHKFISNSDTEVILHAYEEWGLACVDRFIGMFVYVIYDRDDKRISITRDRAGVKPLYYYQSDDLFLFGSELKALMAHPRFKKEVNKDVLPTFFQLGYIPAPHSIFENVFKLNPGHHLIKDLISGEINTQKYWDATDYYRQPKTKMTYEESKDKLHELLKSACNYRMVADVPVGVFLSGGYDSTAVTSILQSSSKEPIKTFTIGFEEGNNEAPFAKETAAYLGTDHTEYFCTTKEAQDIIEELPFYYDEPFGDSSAIPTMLVSRLAKKKVTVALSADAGDELFYGYNRYFTQGRNLEKLNKVPNALKRSISSLASLALLLPGDKSRKYKIHSYFSSLDSSANQQAKNLFSKANAKPADYIASFLKDSGIPVETPYESIDIGDFNAPEDVFLAVDYQNYLQNDILTKVDRATMSTSLEGREPFLDHRLLEFAATLPLSYKYEGGNIGKRILRDIVHEYVPKEMMERPKAGFSIPAFNWLRGDLYYLQEKYLSKEALAWSGLLNVKFVSSEVEKFNQHKMHYSPIVWYLLMFQMWYEKWMMSSENVDLDI